MISSLRSRLWISYVLLILVVLCIVIAGLVISLRQNPLLYRAVILRLNTADSSLTARIESQPNITSDRLVRILEREAINRNVRVMAFNNDGSLMYDSQPEASQNLPQSSKLLNPTGGENINAFTFTDQKGGVWLYTLSTIEGDRSLIVAAPRPEISLWQFLRDDVLRPVFVAGLIALILAILISLGLGNWIIQPIRKMITATRGMPDGEHPPVPMEGPQEIKQLAQSYNDMVQRVASNQQSQRDFLANVTHELKTPLTSIQGYAQAILDDTAQSPEALKQAAGVIYNESTRMNRLVLDLLALTRLETGTADLLRRPFDLAPVLQNVLDKFGIQAKHAQVTLQGNIHPPLNTIGDGDRLAQVFTNLVDNALKFTPTGGQVILTASASANGITVCVSDTGPGISPDHQARIFERFYQVDRSRRGGSGRGVGLGLAIARQIVVAHGGKIWVESAPGKGSQFFVKLPAHQG